MDASGRKLVVLFGDSHTEGGFSRGGWVSLFSDSCVRRAHVHNFGLGGYNTQWALPLLDKICPKGDGNPCPDLVTVFLGGNDAVLPNLGEASVPHVPLRIYQNNLKRMLEHFTSLRTASGVRPAVVVYPKLASMEKLQRQLLLAVVAVS